MISDKIDCMVCKSPTLMEKSEGSNRVPHISLHNKHFIYCQCVGQELILVNLVRMGLAMGEAVEGGGERRIPVAKRTNVQCWWRRVWAIPVIVANVQQFLVEPAM